MSTVMLDTDVYSYITGNNSKKAIPYKTHIAGHTITLSFITVGEQYAGFLKQILMGRWPAKRLTKLESNLQLVTVIPYDIEVCKTFGDIKATLEKSGISVATNDLWIAACAKRHSLVLVTNNRKDFKNIPGLTIISEAP
jgi:tRNA(fMet)-specific endonuclease VapC